MGSSEKHLLIILTQGPEDRGNRATLAFSMGVAALISGVKSTIYMTMGGTIWSRVPPVQKVHIDGFEPLRTYVEQFVELHGNIVVCSPCDEFFCSISPEGDRLPGTRLVGLTYVVDLLLDSSVVTL